MGFLYQFLVPSDAALSRLCIAATYDGRGDVLATWLLLGPEGVFISQGRDGSAEGPTSPLALPPDALLGVFSRYGRPLDPEISPLPEGNDPPAGPPVGAADRQGREARSGNEPPGTGAGVALGPTPPGAAQVPEVLHLRCPIGPGGTGGTEHAVLRTLRFRPFGWVQPLSYLVLERAGHEPLCAPAPLCAAALFHLAQAAVPP